MARIHILIATFGMLFSTSMLVSQAYGLSIGLGTIDRMKLKDYDVPPVGQSISFQHVFGSRWISYVLPLDPVFDNEEEVLHYRVGSTPYYKR